MWDLLYYLRFWLAACFIIGALTGCFAHFGSPQKRIARWFGWTGLATIAGMIALALEALQGPAALNLTSALLFYGFFLSGATMGALIKFGNLNAHESWAAGLAPLMIIWLIAAASFLPDYLVLKNNESRASPASQIDKTSKTSSASEHDPSASIDLAGDTTARAIVCQKTIQAEVDKKNIIFHRQSIRINRHMRPTLDKISSVIRCCSNSKIKVYAYADSPTLNEMNRLLAARRSQAVIEYLIRTGVSETIFETEDYKNISFSSTNDGTAKSRTVHFIAK